MAHGWEGAAWTTLQQVSAGAVAWDGSLRRRLGRALGATADRRDDVGPAQMIGLGGAATVAALASQLEPAMAPIAARVIARWAGSRCAASDDDVHLGHPGALLAIAEIAEVAPALRVPRRFVERCHRRTQAALRRMVEAERPRYFGLAHGVAGLLLASECGAARLGLPRDAELIARGFERLADARLRARGIGTIWGASSSWCHGVSGIALALHGCYLLSGEDAYHQLFRETAGAIARVPSPNQSFCCGRSGRAQVLIELYRQTGARRWLTAARRVVAERTPRRLSDEYPAGFHQGTLGLDYLQARLRDPDRLTLPGTGWFKAR